ncbi:MAG: hypothetical protein LBD11_05405 [Candidatus Peribacteria bacterium]|nr:hypothetical protein [Candidatus Peribacteria bacterium]
MRCFKNTPPPVPVSTCDSPDITIGNYTISACNVGTSIAGLGSASYGAMFQRGNNYGFPSVGTISTTSNTQVDASSYGPTNPYNSSTFIA